MAKSFNKRYPSFGIFLIVALMIAVPLTVWSLNNVSTNTSQYAANSQNTPSSIALNLNPPAALGNTITFALSYPKNTKNPWVSVSCYLDQAKTNLVYGEGGTAAQAAGNGTSKLGYNGFTLGGASSLWLGNYPSSSVYCTAELGNLYWQGGKEYYIPFASTSFTALGKQ
ncbi:MAG TPA: hypothetical protein VES68_01445 [Candidatus Sulfotelmatobacter sp.]|nr:hypothetical protein [Candidatus Sulfotelmatobacter sp.]